MIIVMSSDFTPEQLKKVTDQAAQDGLSPQVVPGESRTIVAVKGDVGRIDPGVYRELAGVEHVELISKPYPTIARRAGRAVRPREVCVVGAHHIGLGCCPLLIGGPCSVKSAEHLAEVGAAVKDAGADLLRAGAFKPRTGPHTWQGLGVEGITILQEVGQQLCIGTASEATGVFRYPSNGRRNQPLSVDQARALKTRRVNVLETVISAVTLPWIGARNGQSFDLIQVAAIEALIAGKPLMLKRGPWMSIDEYLLALEYIAAVGCQPVACLRGVNHHDVYRYAPDIADIQVIQHEVNVPVIADPSHMAGDYRFVENLAQQAIVAGADGLMIEVSTDREQEKTDGRQAIDPETFARIAEFAHAHHVVA